MPKNYNVAEYIDDMVMDYDDDFPDQGATLMANIFNHAMELTKLIVENDSNIKSADKIYKTYQRSVGEVMKTLEHFGK
ncbi:hypothetical protein [Cysteiniphilum sp. 6C5]|uniref:hypothetical protein n=1 Tax=unclassified Cysteiniphilum TaxID=2610889 RepID=UPI003F837BDD